MPVVLVNPATEQTIHFYPRKSLHADTAETGSAPVVDHTQYTNIVVFFSGGKDSVAAFLHLLELGVPREKIELHHHLVDGKEGGIFMDWPVSDSYCAAFAAAFGVRYIRSWKVGGFEREMLREDARTAPIAYERLDGTICSSGGTRGDASTRLKFPQRSADLSVRWCSAYMKVDVGVRVLTRETRFSGGKTLVITGERAEESANRARYQQFEPHRAHRIGKRTNRHIDHWRPIQLWSEKEVWAILERHKINPHPAYKLGFGRASCRFCIFLSPDHWATLRKYMPAAFARVANHEASFTVTIVRGFSINDLADQGVARLWDEREVTVANSEVYTDSVIVAGPWILPCGAYGDSTGPT